MIYTFYGRVSTDSTEQLAALDNQEQYWLDKFKQDNKQLNHNCGVFYSREGNLEKRNGYYLDEGYSGYKAKKYRKAFSKMLEDAKLKKFDMIYTRSVSRFGRNVKEIINTVDDLRAINVGVYFEDINCNTLDSNDDFKLLIFAGLAQEESRLKSVSVQKGKAIAAKKESQIWSGREPYGYDIVAGKLVINKFESIFVKRIFQLYLRGYGQARIAKYLNNKKVPRKRNATKWDQSIIGKMLINVIYKGDVWQHRTYIKNPQLNIVETVPEDEQIKYHNENLRIIDDITFDKVQELKQERFEMFGDFKYEIDKETGNKKRIGINKTGQRYSGAHLFSNLLRCGNCGGTMRHKKQTSTSGKVHHYWFCIGNDKLGSCDFRNLQRQNELIEWVKNEIEKMKNDEDYHEYIFNMIMSNKFSREKDLIILDELKVKYEKLKRTSNNNFEAWDEGMIDKDEYNQRSIPLQAEMKKIKSEIDKYENIENEKQKVKDQFNSFRATLHDIDIAHLDNHTLRQIVTKIVCTTSEPDNPFYSQPHRRMIHWRYMGFDEFDIADEYYNPLV